MSEIMDITPIFGVGVVCPEIGKCHCGAVNATVGKGAFMHAASMICADCGRHRKWPRTDIATFPVETTKVLAGRLKPSPFAILKKPSPPLSQVIGHDEPFG
jgi:hypothetical protein